VSRDLLSTDGLAMLGVAMLTLGVCWHGRTILRRDGLCLLVLYAAFLAWTVRR